MLDSAEPVSALSVLVTADPLAKAQAARDFRAAVLAGRALIPCDPPDSPARPQKPDLVPASQLARRQLGSPEGRAALLHAIAHIELNAIDLAMDMIARFAHAPDIIGETDDFVCDWSSVANDEARHFVMIEERLTELGFSYGDFPAHGGLWDAAMATRSDVAARLAIAPLVLEARGLDVTPGLIEKLDQARDTHSADILKIIYEEEVGHVAIGMKWLRYTARVRKVDPETLFKTMVTEFFNGRIRPPFNHVARSKAQFPLSYYTGIVSEGAKSRAH